MLRTEVQAPNKPAIKVWFNNGENAMQPWHVGLHDGRCVVDHYATFRSPIEAINHAINEVSKLLPDLEVDLPKIR